MYVLDERRISLGGWRVFAKHIDSVIASKPFFAKSFFPQVQFKLPATFHLHICEKKAALCIFF
jgi:hypothetical protein